MKFSFALLVALSLNVSALTLHASDYEDGDGTEITSAEVEEFGQNHFFRGYRCCAADSGWEEHGPHCVEAVTRLGGEARAVAECQRFHGRCMSRGCEAR